jgi:predicted GNAT family acetyltransferase
MTGFNAQTADIVQIGGVYTPPPLRSRGHARRAVALHLAEARDRGVRAPRSLRSGAAAARAYEAIGFHACRGMDIIHSGRKGACRWLISFEKMPFASCADGANR